MKAYIGAFPAIVIAGLAAAPHTHAAAKAKTQTPPAHEIASAQLGTPVSSSELAAFPEITMEEDQNIFDEIYDLMKRSGESIAEGVEELDISMPSLDWDSTPAPEKKLPGTPLATAPATTPTLEAQEKPPEPESGAEGRNEPDLFERIGNYLDL